MAHRYESSTVGSPARQNAVTQSKANSAFHPSGVGKWVPASAGKAKTCMVHSVSGCVQGVQVKLYPWEHVPYLSTLEVWSRQGAIQIYVYLYLYLYVIATVDSLRDVTCLVQLHLAHLVSCLDACPVKHDPRPWPMMLSPIHTSTAHFCGNYINHPQIMHAFVAFTRMQQVPHNYSPMRSTSERMTVTFIAYC